MWNIKPRENISPTGSTFFLRLFFWNVYGAINPGVPQRRYIYFFAFTYVDKPKSTIPIFISLSFDLNIIFYGFISLWYIYRLFKYYNPYNIYLIIIFIYWELNICLLYLNLINIPEIYMPTAHPKIIIIPHTIYHSISIHHIIYSNYDDLYLSIYLSHSLSLVDVNYPHYPSYHMIL
jgi:hypothetical protein